MNNNINLCKILKGHEGETFYSPILGDLKLESISNNELVLHFKSESNPKTDKFLIGKNGKLVHGANEIAVYPSKDQRDWDKWVEENNPKTHKTWDELQNKLGVQFAFTDCKEQDRSVNLNIHPNNPIEKSALALLKIYQLIEVEYGGNISKEEWNNINLKSIIVRDNGNYLIINTRYDIHHIAFHNEEQAKEFISYNDNVKLLDDYFMI